MITIKRSDCQLFFFLISFVYLLGWSDFQKYRISCVSFMMGFLWFTLKCKYSPFEALPTQLKFVFPSEGKAKNKAWPEGRSPQKDLCRSTSRYLWFVVYYTQLQEGGLCQMGALEGLLTRQTPSSLEARHTCSVVTSESPAGQISGEHLLMLQTVGVPGQVLCDLERDMADLPGAPKMWQCVCKCYRISPKISLELLKWLPQVVSPQVYTWGQEKSWSKECGWKFKWRACMCISFFIQCPSLIPNDQS